MSDLSVAIRTCLLGLLLMTARSSFSQQKTAATPSASAAKEKPLSKIRVLYFTDPVCSACWSIEPQLKKFLIEYGRYLNVEYKMGGLLQSWDTYDAGGIKTPADVSHHWDEMSKFSGMPIDGEVWMSDPLPSSFPPCVAVKAAQLQSSEKAAAYLRRLREMVMTEKKNICRWVNLQQAGLECGLDTARLRKDYVSQARTNFEEDLRMGSEYAVLGFPAIFFIRDGKKELVYGVHPFADYEKALKIFEANPVKKPAPANLAELFKEQARYATKEISEITGLPPEKAKMQLDALEKKGVIRRQPVKNSEIWVRK